MLSCKTWLLGLARNARMPRIVRDSGLMLRGSSRLYRLPVCPDRWSRHLLIDLGCRVVGIGRPRSVLPSFRSWVLGIPRSRDRSADHSQRRECVGISGLQAVGFGEGRAGLCQSAILMHAHAAMVQKVGQFRLW